MRRALIFLIVVVAAVGGGIWFVDYSIDEGRRDLINARAQLGDVEDENERLLKQVDLLGDALAKANERVRESTTESVNLRKQLRKLRAELREKRQAGAGVRDELAAGLQTCAEAMDLTLVLRADLDALNALYQRAIAVARAGRQEQVPSIEAVYGQLAQRINDNTTELERAVARCQRAVAEAPPAARGET